MNNNKTFIKGAIVLIIFNLIGKVIGAFYRIPLANILGTDGIGKYQLVFPLYSLLLTISTSGVPVAISKLVSEMKSRGEDYKIKKLLRSSVFILVGICFAGSIILACLSNFIAGIQGNKDIYFCYYAIIPAIMFVGIISAFRGYFQGLLNMFPTAISGLIEQVVKFGCGMFFSIRLLPMGVNYAVFGALLGISVSEFFAMLFLWIYYAIYSKKHNKYLAKEKVSFRVVSKELSRIAVPITLGNLIAPISAIIDSLLVINLLKNNGNNIDFATRLFGLETGIVEPLTNIPIVIAVSISASLLPNLAKFYVEKKTENVKSIIEKAFQFALSVSFACAICFVIFGKQILNFLYTNNLNESELIISTKLLFLGAINLVFLSLVQVSTGVLQGMGKQGLTIRSLLVASVIKIVSTAVFVSQNGIGIFGTTISCILGYGFAFFMNYRNIKKYTGVKIDNVLGSVIMQESFVTVFAYFSNRLLTVSFGEKIAMFGGGFIAVLIFLVSYYLVFMLKRKTDLTADLIN